MSNRIVSSTIVRPEMAVESERLPQGVKRSRQSSINSRLRFDNGDSNTHHNEMDSTMDSSEATVSREQGEIEEGEHVDEHTGQDRSQKRARREEVVPPSQLTATVASSTTTETTDAAAAAATATTTTTTATTAPPAKASESTPVVAEENNRRGRRMMGMILGTLTQFKKDHQKQATNDKGAASRAALQERVREKLKREQELNRELHEKERQERLVKRGVTGAGQKWDNGFILTETKPRLRYMPKVMNDATRQKLEEQLQLRGPSKAQATVAISSEANTGKDGDVDMTEPSHQDTIVEPENMEVNHDDATLSKDSENSPDKTGGGPTSEELGSNVKQDEKTESLSECETADVEMAKSPSRESKAEETETS